MLSGHIDQDQWQYDTTARPFSQLSDKPFQPTILCVPDREGEIQWAAEIDFWTGKNCIN